MTELLAGIALGLSGGVSPGPLQALIVSSTLRGGFGPGWRVAVAPLLTDVIIVGAALAAVGSLPDSVVRIMGIGGGVVLIGFGLWEIGRSRFGSADSATPVNTSSDMVKGAVVNLLNPHPWIFWIGVGAPYVVLAWERAPGTAVAFLAAFYVCLVGAKVALAGLVAAGRGLMSPEWHRRMALTGGLLLVTGGVFVVWQAA